MVAPGWGSSFRKTQIGGYGSRLSAIGPAEGRTRWLGRDDAGIYFTTPISRKYFITPG
jgi:hypothetical protein